MIKLYELIENDTGFLFPWNNMQNDSDPCSWYGVSCSSGNSSVVRISLSKFSLTSLEILPLACKIDTLEFLDVSDNHFSLIPDGFIAGCGGISGLKFLNFSRNKLGGFLPTFVGFGMLEYLDLGHNFMSGNISSQLAGLNSLKSLNLSNNRFSGPVPTILGKLYFLQEFQLSANLFEGEIPAELMNYGNLTLIDFSDNRLSGRIPNKIGALSKLDTLVLSSNNLNGEIPSSLSTIQSLSRFAANQNDFVGKVPPGITGYLRNLDLSFNKLSGTIPVDILSQPNLESLDLSWNSFEGAIPVHISSTMVRLRLGGNSLNGTLPSASFGRLTNLVYLELDNNKITGSIPLELASCKNLALLNLAGNQLSGGLPAELGKLTNLQGIYLQQNNLVGMIPVQLMNLQILQRMNLSWNSLNGSIPNSVSLLKNLMNLDLRGNRLSGLLPDSIGSLNSLLELQLGTNQFTGNVPLMPTSLMIALNLSSNLFQGPIPQTLSALTALEILDLSNNQFDGEIPNFLTLMLGLSQLLLSNNQLSGITPMFKPYVSVTTSGNKDLINATWNAPPASQRKRKPVSVGTVIAVAVAAAATAALLAFIIVYVTRRRYSSRDVHMQPEESLSDQCFLQGNLLTPNGIHRSNIDLVKATQSVLVPSNIVLRTKFSTYYKAVMPSGMTYLVKKLNWSDKILRFGNHNRFAEELEVLGRLSNSNVMIPLAYVLTTNGACLLYEFVLQGTLFNVLHDSSKNILNWSSRYSIAIGIAQALAFLHGRPSGPILLLDLCSRSVLLKSLNEPLVGDVELCKVIDPSKSTTSLSTVAGSVGYIPQEYAYTMRITTAGNVYSFGVVLLELLTGKQAVSQGIELAKWACNNSVQQNQRDEILDFRVSKTSVAVRNQMMAVLEVALACVSSSPQARPKMKSVLRMLLNAR